MSGAYQAALKEIFTCQASILDLHPFLAELFPVAIVEDDHFLIYQPEPESWSYVFQARKPTPMPVPAGVRAAFPLGETGAPMACVVTPEIFEEPGGYVTIFHEFIHCVQFTTCELELKSGLGIAQAAQARGDFMWEIEYPFPYGSPVFSARYAVWLEVLRGRDEAAITAARQRLKTALSVADFEYLVWQEWKEGFARWLENRMRARFDLPPNHNGSQPPFSRVSFYAGGAAYIEHLTRTQPGLSTDLVALFERLRT